MRPHLLAYTCFALPLVVTHAAWLINLHAGAIPACNPYLDGCVSISRAVRSGDGLLLFRMLMLPWTALLAGVWLIAAAWLRAQVPPATRRALAAAALGLVAATFCALYVTFLGEEGRTAQLLRRYGINLFFGGTVLAQMLVASLADRAGMPGTLRQAMLVLLAAMLLMGLTAVALQNYVSDRDALLNAIEWCYALLMLTVFGLLGRTWQRQGLRLRLQAQAP